MTPIKVLVVDDHTIFRSGIVSLLASEESLKVMGEASNGIEAIKKAREINPDVILMDLNMPECNGLEATQALQADMPEVNILILTVSESQEDLFSVMKFGAKGYILKDAEPEELISAIFHIARGGVMVSPAMANKLITEFKGFIVREERTYEEKAILSSREEEVIQLVAQGATNKEIGERLFISENTVKTHLRNIMEKLHLANRSQAAAYAVKRGLVSPKETER
ncbi:response regulator [Chloroflexota bacterium]